MIGVNGEVAGTALTSVRPPAVAKKNRVGRRRWPWALLAVAVIAAGVLTARSFGTSAVVLTPYHSAPPHLSVPSGYHITYRIRTPGSPTSTQEVWVRRPFEDAQVQVITPDLPPTALRLPDLSRMLPKFATPYEPARRQLLRWAGRTAAVSLAWRQPGTRRCLG